MRRLSLHNDSQVDAPARWPLLSLLAAAFAFPSCAGEAQDRARPHHLPQPLRFPSRRRPATLLGKTLQLGVAVTGTENTAVV